MDGSQLLQSPKFLSPNAHNTLPTSNYVLCDEHTHAFISKGAENA
jgi:hypothetical protein